MPEWLDYNILVGEKCFIRLSEKALVLDLTLSVNPEPVREFHLSSDAPRSVHFHPCGEGA